MPDLTQAYLPILRNHRLPNLDLEGGFIYPNYQGYSILNIPSSLCRWMETPGFGAGPLQMNELDKLAQGARKIIFILMDALGLQLFQGMLKKGLLAIWQDLLKDGLLAPLTSISPSTTSAALTSLWTGRSPAEHGIIGYELWLKEYGIVTNMILHAPISYRNDTGSLTKAGFQPETYLPFTNLGTYLGAHGVKPYAFQHTSILRSGLSQMLYKDVETRSFNTSTDLWLNLRDLVNGRSSERQFIWVYWGEVDHYSHLYGPEDERPAAEFANFSQTFEKLLLNQLRADIRNDTLLILTADHGQISTPQNPHYELRNHPDLLRRLHILPTGENRFQYLFVRPEQVKAVQEYYMRTWPGQFTFLDPSRAVQEGLFGPGKPHAQLYDRLGDTLALARENAYLWWAGKDNPLLGRHGGLSPDEMLVPFLMARM
jgi:hypothetical protein